MKKIIVIICIISSTNLFTAQAQTFEIIDAIAGSLLPRVVEGIKEIKNSGNSNNIRLNRQEFQNTTDDINSYINEITTALSNDARNLDAIGTLAVSATLLYDDLGALESFSHLNLIDAVISSNNEAVQRQFAYAYFRDLAQLRKDIDGVKSSVLNLNIDQGLKDILNVSVDAISSDYTDLESFLSQSGTSQPTSASTIDQISYYLSSIKNSNRNIQEIKTETASMLSILNSRLRTYVKSTTDIKPKVDQKFSEIK